MLKPFWQQIFVSSHIFAWLAILALSIPRIYFVLHAQITQFYGGVSIIFLLMWIAPFIFLSKQGKQRMGLNKPYEPLWLLYGFAIGFALCTLGYGIAYGLFGDGEENWLVYISKSYKLSEELLDDRTRLIYFLIFSCVSMTFSPIGEELFYRGIVHEGFKEKWGDRKASHADSLVFAFTHLAHFGIVYINDSWKVLWIPSLFWVFFMFISSKVFYWARKQAGSIWGAVCCHAGFNLSMIYLVFYIILE